MEKPVGTSERDARDRLAELADQRGVSLAALSRLIRRNGTYLQQFITKGSPRRLAEQDRRVLAQFFGVAEVELGLSIGKSYEAEEWAEDFVRIPRLPLGASGDRCRVLVVSLGTKDQDNRISERTFGFSRRNWPIGSARYGIHRERELKLNSR